MDLDELANHYQHGDDSRFSDLWEAILPTIHATFQRLRPRGTPQERDEVVDEVASFLVETRAGAWKQEEGTFEAWIAGVAKNRTLQLVRRSQQNQRFRRQPDAVPKSSDGSVTGLMESLVDVLWSASKGAARRETIERVQRALPNLSHEQRRLADLIGEGHNQAEIARRLGVHPSTVGRQIEKLRERFTSLIGGASRNDAPGLTSLPTNDGPRAYRRR